ncbi:MAG: type II toxin-antitoxin system Phd/YefM family antitoxin [Chloroflexi bacterium]|nr:type II toxin-antitoxin system Phd/YefM family antitoxin [Chloroflexota bacterium]
MNKIIGVTELQRQFRTVFDEVVKYHVPYVLTRGSRPEAVLVPYEQYLKFAQADEAGVLKRFDALSARLDAVNARYSDAEVEMDLRAATKTVRARKRDREKHANAARRR